MADHAIKILIVEDEMLIGAKISMFLSELGYEVSALLPRAEEAIGHVKENMPDIAILDIRLKGVMDGIALAEHFLQEYKLPVIFLTANSDDATFQKAKEAKPFAFLSKPFKKTDLQRAIELTIAMMADTRSSSVADDIHAGADDTSILLDDRIFIRHKDKLVKVLYESILYVEADRNYCKIYTKERDYLLTMPMKRLEDKLPASMFHRIHRSHVVNLRHVDEVTEGHVILHGHSLPLSHTIRQEFLQRFRMI